MYNLEILQILKHAPIDSLFPKVLTCRMKRQSTLESNEFQGDPGRWELIRVKSVKFQYFLAWPLFKPIQSTDLAFQDKNLTYWQVNFLVVWSTKLAQISKCELTSNSYNFFILTQIGVIKKPNSSSQHNFRGQSCDPIYIRCSCGSLVYDYEFKLALYNHTIKVVRLSLKGFFFSLCCLSNMIKEVLLELNPFIVFFSFLDYYN